MTKICAAITEAVCSLIRSDSRTRIMRVVRGDNYGPHLSELYFWETVHKLAEQELKAAWARAQSPHSASAFMESDEELRAAGPGEHIVVESKQFTLVAKVTKPVDRFDPEAFIAHVARQFKISPVKLRAIADQCKRQSKPSLSKRILEAA